jgi:DNA-binding beta-propeller fold protein YncE
MIHRRCFVVLVVSVCIAAACSSTNDTASRSNRSRPRRQTTTSKGNTTTPANSANIYADAGKDMLSPTVRGVPYRLYAPDSAGDGVDVIDPAAGTVIDHYKTGLNPQHVVPSWDLKTLYVTNDLANTLTPIDPVTGKPSGPNIPVDDPYNLYFTPDGTQAIVVAEAQQRLDSRDPRTFRITKQVPVDCNGVDHADFSADATYLIATCEFSGKLVKVDLRTKTVVSYLEIGGSPQDIKLDAQGKIFYVADRINGGVHEIDAATFTDVGFIPTGKDAHGLYMGASHRLGITKFWTWTVRVCGIR